VKKIRKELRATEQGMVEQIFDYFRSLPFFERVKLAIKIIRKKI
jgi:hypothetical protein